MQFLKSMRLKTRSVILLTKRRRRADIIISYRSQGIDTSVIHTQESVKSDFEQTIQVPDDAYFIHQFNAYRYANCPDVDHPINDHWESFCDGYEAALSKTPKVIPNGWKVCESDGMVLIKKFDGDGNSIKACWIDPEKESSVVFEYFLDAAKQGEN